MEYARVSRGEIEKDLQRLASGYLASVYFEAIENTNSKSVSKVSRAIECVGAHGLLIDRDVELGGRIILELSNRCKSIYLERAKEAAQSAKLKTMKSNIETVRCYRVFEADTSISAVEESFYAQAFMGCLKKAGSNCQNW